MPLSDHIVTRDKFEPEETRCHLAFPCCACRHSAGADSEEPCRTCGHNANAQADGDEA